MQRTTVVTTLVTAVVFALIGWFAAPKPGNVTILVHPHGSKDCKGRDCDVTIKFDCVDPTKPATCEAYAVEEVILVNPNHKIVFTIDNTTNYDFNQTDGIKFTSQNANSYFPCMPQGKQKYKCDIANGTPPDLYKYSIHVQGMNTTDPWVVSQ